MVLFWSKYTPPETSVSSTDPLGFDYMDQKLGYENLPNYTTWTATLRQGGTMGIIMNSNGGKTSAFSIQTKTDFLSGFTRPHRTGFVSRYPHEVF